MHRQLLVLVLTALSLSAHRLNGASVASQLEGDPLAAEILRANPIRVTARQEADVPFAYVTDLVRDEDALSRVQEAYAETLPQGRQPEFVITPVEGTTNRYTYVNRKGIRTDVREIMREVTPDGEIRLAYHVKSRRFFGPFTALITLSGRAIGDAGSACEAEVYAYPARAVPRFLIRHLRLVERFFKSKTEQMRSIFTAVVLQAYEDASTADESRLRLEGTAAANSSPL